jgi:hypothetical protein
MVPARAGLARGTCHQLRRACLTRLRKAGMALEAVQAQAGHAPNRVHSQTDSGAGSSQIGPFSIAKLTNEALTAQNVRINAVSGATATSQGFIASLQSAIAAADL